MLLVKIGPLEKIFVSEIDWDFFPTNILKKGTEIEAILIKQKIRNGEVIEDETSSLTVH